MEEIGGELDELHHYNDTLLRSSDGNYYLRQTRLLKMPPNAEAVFNQRFSARHTSPLTDEDLKRLRAFRGRHERPRTTVKRVTEKTALLWCVHQMFNSGHIKVRMRAAIIAGMDATRAGSNS